MLSVDVLLFKLVDTTSFSIKQLKNMSCNMGPFSKEKLADLVQEREELWKVNLKANRKTEEKNRIWEEIAGRFSDACRRSMIKY